MIVIEADTDGLLLCKPVDIEQLNQRIAALYSETFGVDECYMKLEGEEFGAAYFYRAKNYVLRDKKGKLVKHGVKFKSSRHCKIYEIAMNRLVDAVLSGTDNLSDIALSLQNLTQYTLSDFTMRAKINKDHESYDNQNALHAKLGRQIEQILKTSPGKEQIEYVVTRGRNYKIASEVESLSEIDKDYYARELEKVFELFGVQKPEQLSLF